MKIERLHVEGFGHFHDREFGPFPAPLTIFWGPNEAGKTTLLSFIRAMLFGFPRNRKHHYPPQDGGAHGGRLVARTDAGETITIARSDSGRRFSVTGADGPEIQAEARLAATLGYASRAMYEAVFAFTLTELQRLESLQDADLDTQIYSAGMGASSLPGALSDLKRKREALFTPSGRKQTVWTIQQEIEKVNEKLGAAAEEASRFSGLVETVRAAEQEVKALGQDHELKAAGRRRLEVIRQGWNDWQLREGLARRLAKLPPPINLPADCLTVVEKHEERIRNAEEELRRTEVDRKKAEEAFVSGNGDARLLQHAHKISLLQASQVRYRDLAVGREEGREELLEREADVDKALASLGAGWDEQRVARLDLAPSVRDELDAWQRAIDSATQALHENAGAEAWADAEYREFRRAREEKQAQFEPEVNVCLLEQRLEEKRSQAIHCRHLREEWLKARAREEALATSARAGDSLGGENGRLLLILVLILAAILPAVGLALGGPATVVSVLAALLIASPALAWSLRNAAMPVASGSALDESNHEVQRLEGMLVEASRPFAVSLLEAEAAERVESELLAESGNLRSLKAEQDQLASMQQRESDLELARDVAAQRTVATRQRLDQLLKDWRTWLSQNEFDEDPSPSDLLLLLAKLEAVREKSRRLSESRERLNAMEAAMCEYSQPVQRLGVEFGIELDAGSPDSITSAATSLINRYEAESKLNSERKRAQVAIGQAAAAVEERRRSLAEAQSELSGLLECANAASVEEFRRSAAVEEERRDIEQKLTECEARLDKLSETVGGRRELEEKLSTRDVASIDHEIEITRGEMGALDARRMESIAKREGAASEIARLTSQEETSALRARREELRTGLGAAAREWSVLTLAQSLMQRAQSRYESENQPAVIQQASEFFEAMTAGRYRSMRSPLGTRILTVEDKNGALKEPHELSRGTQEALYLALRFGLIRQFGHQACSLPVVVDEVLVNFDPERARLAALAFAELSRSNQILVFTCHPTIRDLFCDAVPQAQVIRLDAA